MSYYIIFLLLDRGDQFYLVKNQESTLWRTNCCDSYEKKSPFINGLLGRDKYENMKENIENLK